MKSNIIKKNLGYKVIISMVYTLIPILSFAQPQENIGSQFDLNFSLTVENFKFIDTIGSVEYNLLLNIDRRSIKNISTIYFRMHTRANDEIVFIKAIESDSFNEINEKIKGPSVKRLDFDPRIITISLGSFKPGDYSLFVKVKDDKDNMYFGKQLVHF